MQSIELQTTLPFEVVIIDDNSSEDVSEIEAKALKNGWSFIKKDENSFVADSRARGVKATKGTHVVFIDDDDYFLPNALTHFHHLIELDRVTPWSCRLKIIHEDGSKTNQPLFGVRTKTKSSAFIEPLVSIHATIVPRELVKDHQFDTSLRYYEDIDCWISIFSMTKKWNFSEEIIGFYDRSSEKGVTRVSEETYLNQVHTFKKFLFRHKDPAIQRWSRLRLFGAYHCLGKSAKTTGLNVFKLVLLIVAISKDGNLSWRKLIEGAKLLVKII